MAAPDIIDKLHNLLHKGIETEAETVYFLVEVRKILEQKNEKKSFKFLNFHCNWALHAKLDGKDAKDILSLFETACLVKNAGDNSDTLQETVDRISNMQSFEYELHRFLERYNLPQIHRNANSWANFIALYGQVIKDCPLTVHADHQDSTIIDNITVNIDILHDTEASFFKLTWKVIDKTGKDHGMTSLVPFLAN